jgi:NAD(P)-dependent dehydrogenase (short-subunit alcohol dehydrogenase family)
MLGGILAAKVLGASAKHSRGVASATERSIDGRSATQRLFRLDGKLAWVTGASRGLGLDMAAGLAECGAHVVLSGRDEHTLSQARDIICERFPGAQCTLLAFDVLNEDEVKGALPRLVSAVGRAPDILVNNAGISHVDSTGGTDTEAFKTVLRANTIAPYLLTRACAKEMRKLGWGRVINIGSIVSEIGIAGELAYCASKHAIAGLTRALADKYARDGITVNCICPGFFFTKMTEPLQQDVPKMAQFMSRIPMGKGGRPAEVAGPAVFLASDAAVYVNGAMLVVDGGTTATLHMGKA